MRRSIFSLLVVAGVLATFSCSKIIDNPTQSDNYYRFQFAYSMMDTYYLWREEVLTELQKWTVEDDHVAKVNSLRYKDASGKAVDKWTTLMSDCRPFLGTVTGNTDSFGFDFLLVGDAETQTVEHAVITYTYADSPARQAGLKRGDVFLTLNGERITTDNYRILFEGGTVRLGMENGTTVSLTAVQMYEDPIQTVTTFTYGGKKIGYLHFTNFTLTAAGDLEDVFRQFKADGIDELVLDLRYNGGGYSLTSQCLASMIAPKANLDAENIFNQEIYNANFENSIIRFGNTLKFKDEDGVEQTIRAGEVNPGLGRLWVITTGSSASASESLICGLKPYMPVYITGRRSYGKFCGGYFIQAKDFWDAVAGQQIYGIDADAGKAATENWGIYVMSSRYADCAGQTLSMPDGIAPDYEAYDDPFDGYALGDPGESMLGAVLEEMVPGGGYGVARRGDGSDGGAEGAAGAAEGVQRRSQLGAAASARLMAPRKPGFGALVLERP